MSFQVIGNVEKDLNGDMQQVTLPNANSSKNWKYSDQLIMALTGSYLKVDFVFESMRIMICNDSGSTINFSWDGTAEAGKILTTEKIVLDVRKNSIWLKGSGLSYRIFAY